MDVYNKGQTIPLGDVYETVALAQSPTFRDNSQSAGGRPDFEKIASELTVRRRQVLETSKAYVPGTVRAMLALGNARDIPDSS